MQMENPGCNCKADADSSFSEVGKANPYVVVVNVY